MIVDRFALENHNAVVFATSGAGKSFLVKVELARAILAGTRVIVIDPEGEYARLVASLGGEVIAIRPGSQAGLDPFAVTGSSPGALTTRIATLTTFGPLAGPLGPRQRARSRTRSRTPSRRRGSPTASQSTTSRGRASPM